MKALIDLCIKQPVIAIVLSLILVVLGIAGYQRLELRFFPELKVPTVNVHVAFNGASAQLMANDVTTLIENTVSGINGIDSISSTSSPGNSSITIMFRMGDDFEQQVSDVRDRVSGVRDKLPPDINPPTITVGGNQGAVISIGFTDDKRLTSDIRDYVIRSVQPVLRQLDGVGGVGIMGSSTYAMRIWLNSAAMTSLGVTVTDVKTALTNNNIDFAAGSIKTLTRDYGVVSDARLKNPEDFDNIIIRQSPNGTVRLQDIAKVELGFVSFTDAPMRITGKEGVDVTVDPLQAANPITVAAEVREAMVKIQQNLPPGMQARINYDNSIFLKSAIDETFSAIAEAVVLVMIVVFLFLGSVRASLIPIVTIPVSLISVFVIVYLLGFSINVMSLLAIVLAIGLVVDDAIVMLENVYRHIESGATPFKAAMNGSKEIAMPVIAMTLTLMAVYAPVGFVSGFTAKLFQQFAFTLAGAVFISGFVALTLSPMMCSRTLPAVQQQGRFVIFLQQVFEGLSHYYRIMLRKILSYKNWVLMILLAIGVGGYFLYESMPSEFIPKEDTGIFQINLTSPTGSNLNYTDKYAQQVEGLLKKLPGVEDYITQVSSSWAHITVTLKPWGERHLTTQQIVAALNPELNDIPGVDADAYLPDMVEYGVEGSDINLNVLTTGSSQDLLEPVGRLMKALKQYPGLVQVATNLKFDQQQYQMHINRDMAAELGVNPQDIGDTVAAMMSGAHWGDVEGGGNTSYQVIVQMQKEDLQNFQAINKLYVRSATPADPSNAGSGGAMIPLSSLVKLTPIVAQSSYTHFDRLSSASITARLASGYSESEAIDYINKMAPDILGDQYKFAFSGKAKQFLDSSGSMTGFMVLALAFIYLVLAAQFLSFVDPLIVLLSVPLSVVGALISLRLTGGSLSLYSQIGLVTLVGMISKHGILITQFANDLRRDGKEIMTAIVEAAAIRLRPILMTTMAMVFGTLPLAFATGPGSVGRQQIGWVIVGGLLLGTFFSLIVVPVAFVFIKVPLEKNTAHKDQ
ncbi:MAG: multidrug transporter AcrB [Gammaproteobacteria bacterium RIFCSPHIGHO2_12_FULL_41_15]|nr:MAG: multidrug transporter AcrB [Gammaproteobacteria bacterium RIFCSPHIGHO2_12_FULL_41_15]